MSKQASFQWLIAVNWHRKPYEAAALSVDVMAAIDTKQRPAAPLDNAGELATG
jgi:hypothetical protein